MKSLLFLTKLDGWLGLKTRLRHLKIRGLNLINLVFCLGFLTHKSCQTLSLIHE
uniref:Uncharacterized protein n=1 Tax=Helianthus annuus TaxID=4232 RepID=A0A251TTT7_HELAN